MLSDFIIRHITESPDYVPNPLPVLGQTERVVVNLLAQAADVVPDLVLDLGQLLLGLLRDLDHIKLGIDVAWGKKMLR